MAFEGEGGQPCLAEVEKPVECEGCPQEPDRPVRVLQAAQHTGELFVVLDKAALRVSEMADQRPEHVDQRRIGRGGRLRREGDDPYAAGRLGWPALQDAQLVKLGVFEMVRTEIPGCGPARAEDHGRLCCGKGADHCLLEGNDWKGRDLFPSRDLLTVVAYGRRIMSIGSVQLALPVKELAGEAIEVAFAGPDERLNLFLKRLHRMPFERVRWRTSIPPLRSEKAA